jgi:hypothetical protein
MRFKLHQDKDKHLIFVMSKEEQSLCSWGFSSPKKTLVENEYKSSVKVRLDLSPTWKV